MAYINFEHILGSRDNSYCNIPTDMLSYHSKISTQSVQSRKFQTLEKLKMWLDKKIKCWWFRDALILQMREVPIYFDQSYQEK